MNHLDIHQMNGLCTDHGAFHQNNQACLLHVHMDNRIQTYIVKNVELGEREREGEESYAQVLEL